jgi:hypothetical protein
MTTENLLPLDNPIDISILLPTRGRPKPLEQCLRTLLDRAKDPSRIEVMLAFDNDDSENIKHFVMPLRAEYLLDPSPIVILHDEELTGKQWQQLSYFK